MGDKSAPFEHWVAALERRHLSRLTFTEVRKGLSALSSLYVERRERLASGAALEGEGKRAAFSLYYGPLHFLTVTEIVRSLNASAPAPERIVDLGCGSGSAGAAWALQSGPKTSILGIDRSAWAVSESRWCYRELGLRGIAQRADVDTFQFGGPREGVIAAFTVNEYAAPLRRRLLDRLLDASRRGTRILVVEPIAKKGFAWWESWADAFREAGGRSDEWRFVAALPEQIRLLDKATGMDHRELTARSLALLNGDSESRRSYGRC